MPKFVPTREIKADCRCVCSNYDLGFTIVGGDADLIDRLLRSDVLECIEVTPETRADSLVRIPE